MAVSNRTAARYALDHPHFASVVARLRPPQTSMPFHVILPNTTNNGPAKSPGLLGGYLGAAYDPFVLGADPGEPDFRVDSLASADDSQRIAGRQSLLTRFDQQQRAVNSSGAVDSMNVHYQRAFNMLTAPESRSAFDLNREPERVRDRYGHSRNSQGQSALLARRLVEAGVPFVSVFSHVDVDRGSWDTHRDHNARVQQLLPPADQAFAALLEDLHTRGMLDETLVIWLGEFGRTPRMGVNVSNNANNVGGRDHWSNCYSIAMAGGGVRGGQVIGSSDQFAAYPSERLRPRQRTVRRPSFI